jgi:hypothetical protein
LGRSPSGTPKVTDPDIIFLPAERVAVLRIAGTDPGVLETAQIVAAEEKTVLQQNLLSVPAGRPPRR